ncbi:hypothetical protein TD95_002952 [Thielaviopsis punctulata]|uniref:Uncharacterized protein n=1 Tax=Thielaviopsis punctulata TaxID=72032 RepID=A0A0F4ZLI8_9PEZI|nr:hypothetical protein TD95_002952 [Thielaviopsis punctulata]
MADSPSHSSKLPVFLPPASPTQLLSYILAHYSYPSTLLIASSKADFLRALIHDATSHSSTPQARALLATSLFQTAIAKHIRLVFVPTASHLRAHLAVFSPADSPVAAPPGYVAPEEVVPALLVYGLLDVHRESSEWNAQGVMRSLSAVVDAAVHTGFSPVLVEPVAYDDSGRNSLDKISKEEVPLLGYRQGGDTRLSKRAVPLGRIIQRWFRFSPESWADITQKAKPKDIPDHEHATQEDAAMTQADE